MLLIFIIFILPFLVVPTSTVKFQQCRLNEKPGCWNQCEPQCVTPFSRNILKENCRTCTPGCVCQSGFIRNPLNGLCVHKNYCPLPDYICRTHEMFSVCGAACQQTCLNLMNNFGCTHCVPGYVCMPGFVRNPSTGLCVTPKECPKSMIECNYMDNSLINILRKSSPTQTDVSKELEHSTENVQK